MGSQVRISGSAADLANQESVKRVNGWKVLCFLVALCAVTAIGASAQTYNILATFTGANGSEPYYGSLVQGFDGSFYGTTYEGGNCYASYGCGTVFRITPGGVLTTIHTFCSQTTPPVPCADGSFPEGGLALGADGNLYGTTTSGGAGCGSFGCGTIFKITPDGALTTLYKFPNVAGAPNDPLSTLMLATDGNFYGTTYGGGTENSGTAFKITPDGTFTKIHNLCSSSPCRPGGPTGGLAEEYGKLYGTSTSGGPKCTGLSSDEGCGTVFRIDLNGGPLTILHNFSGPDGAFPAAALSEGIYGDFYGTTAGGGANHCYPSGCGTLFRVTPGGVLTTLYNFSGSTEGGWGPSGTLVQAADGNFYGTAEFSSVGYGTIFRITPAGTLTVLHVFCAQGGACDDGGAPLAGVVQGTDGKFYGTTYRGAASSTKNLGTVYSLGVGLGPFVEAIPRAGKVGAAITILGTDLTGTTSVSFGGTAANFTVVSSTEITTTVPDGAEGGKIRVTTPSGTLATRVGFPVLP